jgi:hypothetical protein
LGELKIGNLRQEDPGIKAKILFNLNQIKHILRGNKFKTREQFEDQLSWAKRQIIKKKRKEDKKREMVFTNASSK